MFKKPAFFLAFCFLIIKLIFKLCLFSIQYFLFKLKFKKEITPILIFFLLLIWLTNWQLWRLKTNPQIKLKEARSQNPREILFVLSEKETETLKSFYLELETKQNNSRDVLFNLGKLLETNDLEKAQEKLLQSWELDPNY
jgi:predicted negative regulator of RcsB-dependent stress response